MTPGSRITHGAAIGLLFLALFEAGCSSVCALSGFSNKTFCGMHDAMSGSNIAMAVFYSWLEKLFS